MGIATGLSAARMLEIEESTIVGGFIGLDGHLLLQARDGDTVDAGMVRGAAGRDAMYSVLPAGDGTPVYKRLFNIVGGGPSDGGHIQFMLSGLGSLATARRGTVLVHASQRGANGINLRAWAWGFEDLASPLTLYTRQMSETTFEIWALIGAWVRDVNVQVLSNYHTEIALDNTVTVAPSNLVAQTITNYAPDASQTAKGLLEIATNTEVQVGTSATLAVTPVGLAAVVGIGTGYRFVERVLMTSSGTFTKASYPGCRAIRVMAVGGGGAGAGAAAPGAGSVHTSGSGGGGGGYAEKMISASLLAASETVTIGAGGIGPIGAGAVPAGGGTSFGTHVVAGGGEGGTPGPSSGLTIFPLGGLGGVPTAGDILIPGTCGGVGMGSATLGCGGNGGNSQLGAGAREAYTGAGGGGLGGTAGYNYGGGGGGAMANASSPAQAGGNGAPGVVIVEVYR